MAIIGSWSLKNEELTVEVKADLKNIYWSDALGHLKLDNLCYEVCLMNKIGKQAKIKMLPEANKEIKSDCREDWSSHGRYNLYKRK